MYVHVNFILSQSNQKLYLLQLLRSQGLPSFHLSQVFYAIIISWLRYALPVCLDFSPLTQSMEFSLC